MAVTLRRDEARPTVHYTGKSNRKVGSDCVGGPTEPYPLEHDRSGCISTERDGYDQQPPDRLAIYQHQPFRGTKGDDRSIPNHGVKLIG